MFKVDFKTFKDTPAEQGIKYKLFESLQEEICTVIESQGIPIPGKIHNQLEQATRLALAKTQKVTLDFYPDRYPGNGQYTQEISGFRLDSKTNWMQSLHLEFWAQSTQVLRLESRQVVHFVFQDKLGVWSTVVSQGAVSTPSMMTSSDEAQLLYDDQGPSSQSFSLQISPSGLLSVTASSAMYMDRTRIVVSEFKAVRRRK